MSTDQYAVGARVVDRVGEVWALRRDDESPRRPPGWRHWQRTHRMWCLYWDERFLAATFGPLRPASFADLVRVGLADDEITAVLAVLAED